MKMIITSMMLPATIYGLPKTFCLIVYSIATYYYNLASFLSELLDPVMPN